MLCLGLPLGNHEEYKTQNKLICKSRKYCFTLSVQMIGLPASYRCHENRRIGNSEVKKILHPINVVKKFQNVELIWLELK